MAVSRHKTWNQDLSDRDRGEPPAESDWNSMLMMTCKTSGSLELPNRAMPCTIIVDFSIPSVPTSLQTLYLESGSVPEILSI